MAELIHLYKFRCGTPVRIRKGVQANFSVVGETLTLQLGYNSLREQRQFAALWKVLVTVIIRRSGSLVDCFNRFPVRSKVTPVSYRCKMQRNCSW